MGDRPRFRFRLPWLSAITAPRPGEPIRPSILKQTPTDQTTTTTTTTIPINKPPFRPAGIAPSSQTQPPQNTKPRTPSSPPSEKRAVSVPPSQSRNAAQSEVGSQQTLRARVTDQARARGSGAQSQRPNTSQISITETSSPSDARASSVPPSLSRGDAESKFNTKLTTSPPQTTTKDPASSMSSAKGPASSPSPSHITAKGPVSSIPSPERLTSPEKANKKVEPSHNASTTRTSTAFEPKQVTLKQISTRPSASHPGGEAPLRPSPSNKSTQAQIDEAVPQATSPPLQDTTNKASQLLPTTRQPNTSSRDQSEIKTTSQQPNKVAAEQQEDIGSVKPIVTTSLEASKPLIIVEKSKDAKGGEVITEHEKTKDQVHADATQREHANLPSATLNVEKQILEILNTTFRAEQENENKQDLTTVGSNENKIKNVISTSPEEKNMLKNSDQTNKEQAPLHKEIKEDISKFVSKMVAEQPNQLLSEKQVSVITMVGENKGTTMHLGSKSGKPDGPIHIYRGYKSNPDESPEHTTDGEGSFRGKKAMEDQTRKEEAPNKAYINSNTQSINNSILFDSSVNERNPGVQLVFYQKPAETTNLTPEPGIKKAEFNVTTSEKLTYEPTVRRRCLRGLFMESSDSEPDNPKKPRRHGCRYSCGDKTAF